MGDTPFRDLAEHRAGRPHSRPGYRLV